MGDILNRGTRAEPRWYCRYVDIDGNRKQRKTCQTTKELAKVFLANVEARVRNGLIGVPDPELEAGGNMGELIDKWEKTLTNRSAADDRSRLKKHVRSHFASMSIKAAQDLAVVMDWIDQQRAKKTIKDPTIRHNLNLLSRFFSWAIERRHATINPVRQIPAGKRPRQSPKSDVPWLNDDVVVRKLMNAMREPFNMMFYLGNRSGLRPGEAAGLRLSDLAFLDEGVIRVRFSYDGPLKEDKNCEGKTKWAPAPDDANAALDCWIAHRQAQGAQPEDFLFPGYEGGPIKKEAIGDEWEHVAAAFVGMRPGKWAPRHGRGIKRKKKEEKQTKPALTYYQATRHSFVSRNLSSGVSLDEVSAAVGHSSPTVTRRYYDHFVRRTFSSSLRMGIGIKSSGRAAPVVPFRIPADRALDSPPRLVTESQGVLDRSTISGS